VLAVAEHECSVDDHVDDTRRIPMWIVVGGVILDPVRVEDNEVGEAARLEQTAVDESKVLGV
jgi:hypothetical protein